jgi:hypothetical protein
MVRLSGGVGIGARHLRFLEDEIARTQKCKNKPIKCRKSAGFSKMNPLITACKGQPQRRRPGKETTTHRGTV